MRTSTASEPVSHWQYFVDTFWDARAILALAAAIVAIYAIRAGRKQTRDNILKGLVDAFVALKRYEVDAASETDPQKAAELQTRYYESLIDLLWMEFQLWRRRSLDNSLFWTWADHRKALYDSTTPVQGVLFKTVWDNYAPIAYSNATGKFRPLMERVFTEGTAGLRKKFGGLDRFVDRALFWERRWLKWMK